MSNILAGDARRRRLMKIHKKAAERNRRLTFPNGGVERIRTSAAVAHTNDLANRPLQPLEYHSICN